MRRGRSENGWDGLGENQGVRVGLRIDVDTYRGTRLGVPALLNVLAEFGQRASFFFSVGPDNMGRHLWRLRKPAFAWKMIRTRSAKLYGWDVVLRGTFGPGPIIGKKQAEPIRRAAAEGHEIGLHAWDHHAWQSVRRLESEFVRTELERGVCLLTELLGSAVKCSAAPAWRCNEDVLQEKERFEFRYNSDCRGDRILYPVVDGRRLAQPQIPVTLPTFDEAIGRQGVSPANYNEWLLEQLRPNRLNVLAVHAEVEGIAYLELFRRFVAEARAQMATFVPLGELLGDGAPIETGVLEERRFPGREGRVAWMAS